MASRCIRLHRILAAGLLAGAAAPLLLASQAAAQQGGCPGESSWSAQLGLPRGASESGFNALVFDLRPSLKDVAPGRVGPFALFDGLFYVREPPDKTPYRISDEGALVLPLGKGLASQTRNSTAGALPYLSGTKGFYVEFEMRITGQSPDHWPALWVMPAEHDLKLSDHYAPDPPRYERWMELDVHEGGFNPGSLHSVIAWEGVWNGAGSYKRQVVNNATDQRALDQTVWHRYGAAYQPVSNSVCWYVDDELRFVAAGAAPAVAHRQNFYVIAGAQSHGKSEAYELHLRRVRAYSK